MSLSISVRELNIKLYTNRQNDLDKSDLFTSSNYMPEHTGGFSKLPYFTLDIYYPNELNELDMADRKQFFFNKDFFISKLTELVPNFKKNNFMLEGLAGKSPTEIKEYYVKRDERIDHNVSKTIELLFPTKEPIINDNHTSFDYIKNNKYKHNFWIDPLNTNSSYLQFGSSIINQFGLLYMINSLFTIFEALFYAKLNNGTITDNSRKTLRGKIVNKISSSSNKYTLEEIETSIKLLGALDKKIKTRNTRFSKTIN